MSARLFKFLFFCAAAFIFLLPVAGLAQIVDPLSRRVEEDEPKNLKESRARLKIEQEKKEYEVLLARSEEAVAISNELEKTFAASETISAEDAKKLEKLEKLVKKIRSELGGSDDDPDDDRENPVANPKPRSLNAAFKSLQASAASLLKEIRKSTRYSISVTAIRTSNVLLKVLKFIKIGN